MATKKKLSSKSTSKSISKPISKSVAKSGAGKKQAKPAESKFAQSKFAMIKNALLGGGKKKAVAKTSPKKEAKKEAVKPKEAAKPTVKAPVKTAAKPDLVATANNKKTPGKSAKISGKKTNPTTLLHSASMNAIAIARGTAPRPVFETGAETVCREVACEGLATAAGYCRLHYVKNWKKIKRKELILKEKKLNRYIEELIAKYPDKYIEAIRQDLTNDKDFAKVIHDLDLDESVDEFEAEGESADSLIGSIKRDFEDDTEGF